MMDRFWNKVDRDGECWEWRAGSTPQGYGRIRISGKNYLAHRVAYALKRGAIPTGACVCHTCDNPACCNPSHLWLGSNADNIADRQTKGRQVTPRGEAHPAAKFTADDVENIRANAVNLTLEEQAALYGVNLSTISRIIRRDTWKHI